MTEREISPLDGRYRDRLKPLGEFFSEFALVRARCRVELLYLGALDAVRLFPPLEEREKDRIASTLETFGDADFARVKSIEAEIGHDVKACELFLREKLSLRDAGRIHFGLTSADVNNLAYGLILKSYRDEIQIPQLRTLVETLADLAERWRDVLFPGRTHGQPASPTTAGKEIAVFLDRLLRQVRGLERVTFLGKLNGATGTYASFLVAFPDFDWRGFSETFVGGLGLEPSGCTTQIESHDALAEYFAVVSRINNVVLDLDVDLWEYVSRGEIVQRAEEAEVGSSTMPHKVNPIRFENSEGNVAVSNALLGVLCDRLTHSRMQRDLSDTTVKRNIGVALAHAYLATDSAIRGLREIEVDRRAAAARVDEAPEVLAEPFQTILRREGLEDPYELLRREIRGKAITLERLHAWVDGLPVKKEIADRLKGLRPGDYTGLASGICDDVVERARAWLSP